MSRLTAQEKFVLCGKIKKLMSQGLSQNRACVKLRVPPCNYVRWKHQLKQGGGDVSALEPKPIPGRPRKTQS